jgi:protein-S-isoprenylcysteine O-methyltransferase Ste14
MDLIDSLRYYLALVVLVSVVPVLPFWFMVHPFAAFWRRLGPLITYGVTLSIMILIGILVFLLRGPLLAIEFGNQPLLWLLALPPFLLALVLEIRCRRYLKFRILVGLPELATGSGPGKLLTEGIYGRIRHPRYSGGMLAILAYGLATNYLAVYLLFLVSLPIIYGISVIEERELVERFGARYQDYRARVPRFVPRLR